MIFIILPVIIIAIIILHDLFSWHMIDGDTLFKSFVFFFVAELIAFMLWFAVDLSKPEIEISETKTSQIFALVDNVTYSDRVSSSIFLIQSCKDDTLQYNYLYKSEQGYAYEEVPAKSCYINYTDEKPYVLCNKYDFKNDVLKWLFPNSNKTEYIFYIPKNAQIINDYIINFN